MFMEHRKCSTRTLGWWSSTAGLLWTTRSHVETLIARTSSSLRGYLYAGAEVSATHKYDCCEAPYAVARKVGAVTPMLRIISMTPAAGDSNVASVYLTAAHIDCAMLKIHRPATPPDIPTPHIIYPSSLALLGQGYALWYPEPHITGEPQIGDVGYVGEGSFIRLFNLNIERKEHQVTFWDPLFTIAPPLPVNVFRVDPRHGSLGPGRFRSHGVQEREMRGSIST